MTSYIPSKGKSPGNGAHLISAGYTSEVKTTLIASEYKNFFFFVSARFFLNASRLFNRNLDNVVLFNLPSLFLKLDLLIWD